MKTTWIKFVSNFNPIMQIFQGFYTERHFTNVNYELQIQNKT